MAKRSWLASTLRSRAGLLQWASIVGALAFVGWILVARGDELRTAFSLTPRLFVLISISAVCTFLVNGIELQVLAGRFERHVPFGEALLLGLMVSALNYLPMKTGTLLNGVLMRARYKVSLSHFGALVIGSSFIHLWVGFMCAGTAMLALGGDPVWAWAFLLAPTAFIAGLVVWGRTRTRGRFEGHESRLVRVGMRAVDGLGMIYSSWRLLVIEVAINLLLVTLAVTRTMWAFEALSVDASFGASVVVTAIGIVAARLSIIPGGLGFKEAGAALGSALTGIQPSLGFAASVVERAVMLVWLLVLGIPATLYLQRITGIDLADAQALRAGGDAESAAIEEA